MVLVFSKTRFITPISVQYCLATITIGEINTYNLPMYLPIQNLF